MSTSGTTGSLSLSHLGLWAVAAGLLVASLRTALAAIAIATAASAAARAASATLCTQLGQRLGSEGERERERERGETGQ